jgi:copper chaperone NosL
MNIFNTRVLLLLICLLWAFPAVSGQLQLPKPEPTDTCPVCGMFVSKYPAWVATVHYRDGHSHHFDGAKDMFKYLLDLPRWAPGHQADQISAIGVTDYYRLQMIDARQAYFVIGSEVYGPMGHELVPHMTEEDAKEFMRDHHGTRIMRFDQVRQKLLENLDSGLFTE